MKNELFYIILSIQQDCSICFNQNFISSRNKLKICPTRMNHAVRVVFLYTNKRERKPKEQSRMENPDILATLGTQETGRRQTKQNTRHRKLKRWATRTPPKTQHRKLKRWATRTHQNHMVSSSCFIRHRHVTQHRNLI
jgi:hypothetical protein